MKNGKGQKILVTGGAGFIGSNFVRFLHNKRKNYIVFNYDALTYAGNRENLSDIEGQNSGRYFFVKGDICDSLKLNRLFAKEKFDAVVNFAAESHVDRSIISSQNFIRVNVWGTQLLIDAAKKYKTPRFVHISTDEIYGDILRGESLETSRLNPSNPYAASKAGADLLVQSYMRTHSLPAVIIRGSNNFGFYQYPEKLIPLTITNLLEGKQVPMHGSGSHIRRWLHVDDFCQAIDLVLHKAEDNKIYNVAGTPKSNSQIISEVCKILGQNFKESVANVGDRPGADFRYAPSGRKIQKELNWEPKKNINETLKDIVEWYKKNENWWRKIKKRKEFLEHYNKQAQAKYY